MATVPAPTILVPREEWPDADFDLPDGATFPASADSDKEDEDDWDLDFHIPPSATSKLSTIPPRPEPSKSIPHMFTIRPPLPTSSEEDEDNDDDEGVSTIKLTALPKVTTKSPPPTIDEDFEDDFALPSDLTQLSLAPLSLVHRSSKSSLEWGDKDQTSSSSQSSDAYSTLGFADNSPSSNYTSASLPETESEQEDDGDLDGLVIPSGLFESGHSANKLARILEAKKKTTYSDDRVKDATPDPEDDFETGLVIDDDTEFSPSRLQTVQQKPKRPAPLAILRSKSVPPRNATPSAPFSGTTNVSSAPRPPSRVKADRAKSPNNPPVSSASQLRKLTTPPSPPRLGTTSRLQTYSQALTSAPPPSSSSFLSPKPGSLRIQKSHTGLKPPSPPATRKLSRKASLPSLSDSTQPQASGSGSASSNGAASSSQLARYEAPTASSRARTHTNTTSRIHGLDYNVPPTRPSTPSANPVALRLTMPTSSSRLKSRTPVSAIFSPASASPAITPPQPPPRSTSPLPPPRPPSSASLKSRHTPSQSLPLPPAIKILKRPKRQRTYGDGTELDGFEDLPLDREKEGRFHVQPKGYGNRIPGTTIPTKPTDFKSTELGSGKGTLRRTRKRDLSGGSAELTRMAPLSKALKRGDISNSISPELPIATKKKKAAISPSSHAKRKPTLIRNLGGSNTPKVVGEMRWNPQILRWEGNDQALRDFDMAIGTSTRPALITHLTGSSIGSPGGSFASGARIVGNMIFDPTQMRWISTLPPDEDEPDVFADLADDEDEEDWEAKGGTIRAHQQGPSSNTCSTNNSVAEPPSPARSHTRSMSESESDRGSRASIVCNVNEGFLDLCHAAEERHCSEMKGWIPTRGDPLTERQERAYLFEIRALATRQY